MCGRGLIKVFSTKLRRLTVEKITATDSTSLTLFEIKVAYNNQPIIFNTSRMLATALRSLRCSLLNVYLLSQS